METEADIVRQAAKRIAEIEAEIKELTATKDALKSYFKDPDKYDIGKHDLGDVEVIVSANRRLSDAKAKKLLSARTLERVSTPKLDPKKARAWLGERELEQLYDNYDHKIEVRLKDGANS